VIRRGNWACINTIVQCGNECLTFFSDARAQNIYIERSVFIGPSAFLDGSQNPTMPAVNTQKFKDCVFSQDEQIPANIAKNLNEIQVNLSNIIAKNYTLHKNINLIALRNYISSILLKYEFQRQPQSKQPTTKEDALLAVLKKMQKSIH